ncbi:MAG: OB-fold nucleic acid binding domain-containing protein, partial [Dehalococcoidia bacterium]
YMRPPAQMEALFAGFPDAVQNTVKIADSCGLDLATDAIYQFPDSDSLPPGHTALSYLEKLCEEAAVRRYGSVTGAVRERLDEELRLIGKHNLAGFFLQYHQIILMAREIQEELGQVEPGLPVEVQPPGRGRGSSVAMLTGYLTGLSHIDPLKFGLRLDRFISDEMSGPPDIDLDFPREIRERLILRVHKRWGYERAVLTGMISTYRVRGAVRDLGRALGLPQDDVDRISGSLDGHAGMEDLAVELAGMPEFRGRLDSQPWQDLLRLSFELKGFPKYLAQHPGGMVLSARPLSETVPLQRSAIDGRYIMQWDKDSADDAGFVKIDFLALGALSQMTEATELIRLRTEERIDLSRIDFNDRRVYESIWAADTIGVFQVESAAQMQTVTRLRPSNLEEMAWEVGAVRPGVGVNDGVSLLIHRHMEMRAGLPKSWEFDHPDEEPALNRTYGVPLFQDQLSEIAVHVAGFSPTDGERMRKAFTRKDADRYMPGWIEKFMDGAENKGVPRETAEKILGKFHGLYQFPESHAYAFGITAFQMQWLKVYHPLEFYVGLFNQQPMGFYSLETLKEDAKRHGIHVLNPDVNLSGLLALVNDEHLRMGLAHVQGVRQTTAERILADRELRGDFSSLADFMSRTGILHEQLESLSRAGALDCFDNASHKDRRRLRWEIGLRYIQTGRQLSLDLPVEQDMVALQEESGWERMIGEYGAMGVHPSGHIMARLRQSLPIGVVRSDQLKGLTDGAPVAVAGIVIRRQRPLAKAVFITLEDEYGHSPLILWPNIYERFRQAAQSALLIAQGIVSRRDGTLNIVVESVEPILVEVPRLRSKDWG